MVLAAARQRLRLTHLLATVRAPAPRLSSDHRRDSRSEM